MRAGVAHDRVRRPGPARAVASTRPEPADRVVDDLDAVRDHVLLGVPEADLGLDADEVELRGGRHCAHDLRDRSPVRGALRIRAILVDQGRAGDRAPVSLEADVDDRHLHASAGVSGRLPRVAMSQRHRLVDCEGLMESRRADRGDSG